MLSLHFWLKQHGKRFALVLFSHMYAIYHGLQLLRLKGRLDYNFTHIQMSVRVLRVRHCDRIVSSYP
jgi:hypothetical protein